MPLIPLTLVKTAAGAVGAIEDALRHHHIKKQAVFGFLWAWHVRRCRSSSSLSGGHSSCVIERCLILLRESCSESLSNSDPSRVGLWTDRTEAATILNCGVSTCWCHWSCKTQVTQGWLCESYVAEVVIRPGRLTRYFSQTNSGQAGVPMDSLDKLSPGGSHSQDQRLEVIGSCHSRPTQHIR